MPARALIVLLLILNLGVALWWATRGPPAPAPQVPLPAGVETLQLLGEGDATGPSTPAAVAGESTAPPASGAAPDAAEGDASPDSAGPTDAAAESPQLASDLLLRPAPSDPAPTAGPQRCRRFGPFPDAAAASRAAAALRPSAERLVVRETRAAARGWDVRMVALADRAAAEAMASRLAAAGFRDHYLLSAAEDGSVDIALGRFGNEDGARRHRDALQAAGFDAAAVPVGDGPAHWIHVALAAQADPAALRRAAGAAQAASIDCATLEAPAR